MRTIRYLIALCFCLGLAGAAASQRNDATGPLANAGGSEPRVATAQQPATVVAVQLQSPDFSVIEMKYRVFFNKTEVKKIPLMGYDFKAALADELMNALAEDARMKWRLPSA